MIYRRLFGIFLPIDDDKWTSISSSQVWEDYGEWALKSLVEGIVGSIMALKKMIHPIPYEPGYNKSTTIVNILQTKRNWWCD